PTRAVSWSLRETPECSNLCLRRDDSGVDFSHLGGHDPWLRLANHPLEEGCPAVPEYPFPARVHSTIPAGRWPGRNCHAGHCGSPVCSTVPVIRHGEPTHLGRNC